MKLASFVSSPLISAFPLVLGLVSLGFAFLLPTVSAAVTASDITIQVPVTENRALITPDIGYDVGSNGTNESPLYTPYNAADTGWWDNLIQELLQGGVSVVNLENRGWNYGSPTVPTTAGNMDPRRLFQFFDAANRAGVPNYFQAFCGIDTSAVSYDYVNLVGNTTEDLSVQSDWANVWWLWFVKAWFDTVPSANWYRINGHPVIYLWSSNYFTNTTGNEVPFLTYIAQQFNTTYGVTPVFMLDPSWFKDPAVAQSSLVVANLSWFIYPQGWGINTLGSVKAGCMVPGWNSEPGKIIPRNGSDGTGTNGETLQDDLEATCSNNASLMLLEGWNDTIEGMGYYRSLDSSWDFPSQYINMVRQYTDLRTVTLRLEAEGADHFSPMGTAGTVFRTDGLDVRALSGADAGWAVTGMPAGGYIEFTDIPFSPGNYKFPVRYASTAAHTLQLSVDGVALPEVSVPSTGSTNTFDTIYLGTKAVSYGRHTIRLTWVDGGVDVDWLFVKKYDPMMSFKAASSNCYLTAESGGNSTMSNNRTAESIWERFSIDDLSGSGTVSSGDAVNLQVYDGLYLTSVNGGGSTLDINRLIPSIWEKFTMVKVSGSGAIATGNQVAFKSYDGVHYLTAVNGTSVDVSGTSIGAAQTFTVNITSQ